MSQQEEGNSTLRYSDEVLNEFKTLFLAKLQTAEAEMISLNKMIELENEKEKEGKADDMLKEQLKQLHYRHTALIAHLKKSLNRIEDKTYGVCKETGKLIEKDILLALPHEKK